MGLLLTFMFLVNMIGAIILLPAMARWFWRHHAQKSNYTARLQQHDIVLLGSVSGLPL